MIPHPIQMVAIEPPELMVVGDLISRSTPLRRDNPQYQRLRCSTFQGEGDPARAELLVDPDHPECLRRHQRATSTGSRRTCGRMPATASSSSAMSLTASTMRRSSWLRRSGEAQWGGRQVQGGDAAVSPTEPTLSPEPSRKRSSGPGCRTKWRWRAVYERRKCAMPSPTCAPSPTEPTTSRSAVS